ncbi:hypothetical protein HMPREF1092_03268 [Clostridium thermobutyricum]|uniref:Uncharacterized protein n=1 Tax=Clostridium thermobutyricum TaxID=29372 RepID=N9XS64_9CLOT|nr:hypothetical protein [Clostridium thermobutyricum]ENY98788.1 hypothetical protein HMPREF1092_03268 [Clostridium thermobutyricum]
MKKTFFIIVGILIIILLGLKLYNPDSNNSKSLVTKNIKELSTYSTNFTVLPAQILEEIYYGDKDYSKIQNQINQIDNNKLKGVLQANLDQYKSNSGEFENKISDSDSIKYTDKALNDKSIVPFNNGMLLPRSSEVIIKDGNRYYITVAYLAYSNSKNQSIDDNNKDIYGISVFNVYNDGQIESLYISSR